MRRNAGALLDQVARAEGPDRPERALNLLGRYICRKRWERTVAPD
jgi:hypothetical protein